MARCGADDKDIYRDFGKAVLSGEPLSQIQYSQASPFLNPFLNLAFDSRLDLGTRQRMPRGIASANDLAQASLESSFRGRVRKTIENRGLIR